MIRQESIIVREATFIPKQTIPLHKIGQVEIQQQEPWSPASLDYANICLEEAPPQNILVHAFRAFGAGLTIGTSFGASGMVMIDMALKIRPDADIFYIDTGFFFQETLDLIERAQQHYGRTFRRVTPDLSVEAQAERLGPALYEHDPDRCCFLRKVLPLEQALAGRTAWITAVRRDQSPSRAGTPIVQWNNTHKLIKIIPLARWTEADVWQYVRRHAVPHNTLHAQGYPSIGCWPCTSPVTGEEDGRAGRWRGLAKTECGLHLVN
jgi:phosphoadenosine phosphosulfate reductase